MLRRAALLLALLAGPACSSVQPRGSTTASHGDASARSVLVAYLDATFSGHHARAWNLLTRADRARTSRTAYVAEQRNLSSMREQVEALGKSKRRIGKLTEHDDRATAMVVLTSGLGSEQLRFVLRREQGHWRIDYGASWATGE